MFQIITSRVFLICTLSTVHLQTTVDTLLVLLTFLHLRIFYSNMTCIMFIMYYVYNSLIRVKWFSSDCAWAVLRTVNRVSTVGYGQRKSAQNIINPYRSSSLFSIFLRKIIFFINLGKVLTKYVHFATHTIFN